MKRKFEGVKVEIGLIPYGLSAEFWEWRKDKLPEMASLYICKDYASDETGELVYELLQLIANNDWNKCIKTIEKIQKKEHA